MHYNTIIFGAGIAGLWLLAKLRERNVPAILLESEAIGAGQSLKSQGIIHGGMKYALQGQLTKASEAIANMPSRWQQHLTGEAFPDLSSVDVLSHYQYFFTTPRVTAKITGFFASKAVKSRCELVAKHEYPEIFSGDHYRGHLYRLNEMVLDVPSLFKALATPYHDYIKKININKLHFEIADDQRISSIQVENDLSLTADNVVFCAGAGNEFILKQLNVNLSMQRRPLHMALAKIPAAKTLFAHAIGMSSKPMLTITSHISADGDLIWYIGGDIAETGVERNKQEQIQATKVCLQKCMPWLDLQDAKFESFFVDRAEAKQLDGSRPDGPFVKKVANVMIAWPTKLAFAPALADEIMQQLDLNANICEQALALPNASFAKPIWDIIL